MATKIKKILFNTLKMIRDWVIEMGLNKIPGMSVVYDFLFQYLWSGSDIIEIQGSKMYINVKDQDESMRKTFQSYALNLTHEERTTELFKEMVKEGDTVVDIGANIGYFTLLSAKLVGKKGRVFAFEPEPKNYNYLLKNIELNNIGNTVLATQKAVSDKTGKTKLYICEHDTGHHTINQPEGIKSYKPNTGNKESFIEIDAVTLDDFLKDKNRLVDIVKIDAEGAEMLVLLGMDKTIRQNHNIKLFVEFFPLLIKKMGNSPEDFIKKLLEDYGFSIFIIGEDYDACNQKLLMVNSVNELMGFCKNKNDHLNLFIERQK